MSHPLSFKLLTSTHLHLEVNSALQVYMFIFIVYCCGCYVFIAVVAML